MSVGVIIVAAGRGERLGGSVPKQLLDLGGRSILARSVAAFASHPAVTSLVVVLTPDLVHRGPELVGQTGREVVFAAGGRRRQDSVQAGFAVMPPESEIVLVHDAARPFADRELIDRVIAASARTGAALPVVPIKDTVKRVAPGDRFVRATEARSELWLAQTPQGFRRDVLERAVTLGQSSVEATDEAMLAEQLGLPVEVVLGHDDNMKITTADDLAAARRRLAGTSRVGTGYDLHRLVAGRPRVLAGVVLPFEKGPLGHSDGDVVCHALTDALLGAAAAGDIGQHFPNTDPRWKDAAGLDLLARAVAIIAERGWRPSNADVTIVLERPKVAPHLIPIREAIARTLGVTLDDVSVKGKTNEGVDAVGAGEAVAAHAVAMVVGGGTS
jgi:2-C-methyl-D-erythritol 4-phosphate cytidylyltransferase/2-C-methyl-D-erythritol 2,4-cyclodiphosphate synthase